MEHGDRCRVQATTTARSIVSDEDIRVFRFTSVRRMTIRMAVEACALVGSHAPIESFANVQEAEFTVQHAPAPRGRMSVMVQPSTRTPEAVVWSA